MRYKSSNDLNKCTSYLYIEKNSGDCSTASGFFFSFSNSHDLFLVTNKHVLENAGSLTVSLTSSIEDSTHAFISPVIDKVVFHPNADIDLCVVNLSYMKIVPSNIGIDKIQIKYIHESMLISQDEINNLSYCEDVIMFGAPHSIYDAKKALSIAFKGVTATPIEFQFANEAQFLVDIPSYPGSSGSAIYLCSPKTMSTFSNTKLVGVFCKAHQGNDFAIDGFQNYIHLGHAIPANKILDFKPFI